MESFRFKVVKIISKEPFKRGRWLCMDFTDPPSNGTTNIEDCLAHNRPDIASSAGQGVSAVAIDNKIEQAMDLVKSHLMFAVREEMDVLKKKILELTEKNNRLEMENNIFRAHATAETIQLVDQFNQQAQIQQPREIQNSPSQQSNQQQVVSLPPFSSSNQQQTNTSPQTTTQQTSAITTINTINTVNTISTPSHSNQPLQISQQQINSQINQQQIIQQSNNQQNSVNQLT